MLMRRRTDKLVVACTAICILCAGAVGVFSATVLDAKDATEQIQAERAENILRACHDTNQRYAKTVSELDRLYAIRTREMTAEQRRAVEASRKATLVVIAAIVPPRKCADVVREQVGTG